MQMATGTVANGKVVVDGEADETFEVPPELEAALQESMAQADRGETISADELIERLRRIV